MAKGFVHVELRTGNLSEAKQFYARLLGWTVQDVDLGGMSYSRIAADEGVGGGMLAMPAGGAAQWLPFVAVADVAATTRKAASLGAKVLQERTPIPGAGSFSVVADPTGATIGFIEHGQ